MTITYHMLTRPQIARTLRAITLLPVPAQRRIVAALACANSEAGKTRDPKKVALAAAHFKKREPVIASMHAAIKRQLDYAKFETLRKIEKSARLKAAAVKSAEGTRFVSDLVFDPDEFRDGLFATLRSESTDALQLAGDQLFEELGRDEPFVMADPKALTFLNERENKLADIPDEIHAEISDEIKTALDEGSTLKQIAQRVSDKFDQISEGRAANIASTETAAAFGYARQEGMKQAGIATKRWLTSHLPNVREWHAEAEDDPRNQNVPVDGPFIVGGESLMYPGDGAGSPANVCNCHCVAVEGIEEEAA